MGSVGIAGFYCDMLVCRLSLSWVCFISSGAQSCVVLCSRASDCVADTCFVVLFGRQGVLRTPAFGQSMCWEPYCLQTAFARHDFNLSDASPCRWWQTWIWVCPSGTIGTVFYLAGCDSVVVGHSVSVAHPCVVCSMLWKCHCNLKGGICGQWSLSASWRWRVVPHVDKPSLRMK